MLTYAIYGTLSMPHGTTLQSLLLYDVIGHFTGQTATTLGRVGCRIVTRPFLSGRVGSGMDMRLAICQNMGMAEI